MVAFIAQYQLHARLFNRLCGGVGVFLVSILLHVCKKPTFLPLHAHHKGVSICSVAFRGLPLFHVALSENLGLCTGCCIKRCRGRGGGSG